MYPVSFILVVSTLHLCPWLLEGVEEVVVRICPSSKDVWDASARRKECSTKGGDYHCVRNQDDKLVESCVPKVWIEGGYCPVLHEANGKFSDELCFTGNACPLSRYLSNTVYMYPVCFENKLNEIAPSTTSVASNTTVNSNIINSNGNTQTQNNWTVTVIACVAAIVPGCILLSILAYCKRKTPRRKPDEQDLETGGEDEKQAFLPEKKEIPHTFQNIDISKRKPIESSHKAKQAIEEEGIVVIVGDIGSGKTTAAEHAMLHVYNKDDMNDWKTEGTEYNFDEDSEDKEKAEQRIMIVLDDCCGKYGTNPVYLNQIKEKLGRLQSLGKISSGRRKVILTLNSAQFSVLETSVEEANMQSLLKCSIKLAGISEAERKEMLAEYLNTRTCSCQICIRIQWDHVKKILEEEMFHSNLQVVGWPLICRLVVIPHIAQHIGEFTDKPFLVLQEALEELRKSDTAAYVGLVYMMLKGGTFDEDSIDQECFRFVLKLHSCLPDHDEDLVFSTKLVTQQLKAIPEYVKNNTDKFTIFHEIVTLALFFSFYKQHPNEAIQYCDLKIIADLFRPENYDSSAEGRVEPLLEALFTREGTSYTGRKTAENKANPKCYFILSEENHRVFMRRVVGEGKLSLFIGHPLMLKTTFHQIN